jgi:hypothetical protein
MKLINKVLPVRIYGFCICLMIALNFINTNTNAQYTSTYNSVSYSSSRPYNLNLVYFVPNDVPLDPTYKQRLSQLILWSQNFYKQNMNSNGYGSKTFGLFTETANPNNVKIVVIHGAYPHTAYTYNDRSKMDAEINAYFANNPAQKTSDHMLIITAVTNEATADVPFYGVGRSCYALDYSDFDIKYLGTTGTNGDKFTKWFGGMVHELGHGLNLPHSHQTNTENNDLNKGMNLMFAGNSTLGKSPTFMNRAGCAILNNCQVFADAPGITYYNGNTSSLTSLHAVYDNGDLVVSGTFQSNRPVVDVNIYQDPYSTPSAGYYAVVWSVSPLGNSFSVRMPISELQNTNQAHNLWIELVLKNGERTFNYYPYTYKNGIPEMNFDFGTTSACVGGSLQLDAGIIGTSYQWQYQNSNGTWSNYPEGNVSGYATFSGTQSRVMTISGVSAYYINNSNTARVSVTRADGSTTIISPRVWKADGITAQPNALTTACVGSSLQISAQAAGSSYQWQYQNSNGTWSNYPEGAVSGYATFTGTKTLAMTVSNISSHYVTNPNQARLVVTGNNGCSASSNTVTWKAITCSTMSAKVKMNTTQAVYPNPVNDYLNIDMGTEDDNYQVEIMNSVGQTIYHTTTAESTLKIPFKEKASGVYIIRVTGKISGSSNSYRVVKP